MTPRALPAPPPPSESTLTFLSGFLLLGGVPAGLEEGRGVFLLLRPDGFGAGVRVVLLIAAGGGWGTRGHRYVAWVLLATGASWGQRGCPPPSPVPFFLLFFSFFSPFTWNMAVGSFLVLLEGLALPSGSLLSPGGMDGEGDRGQGRRGEQRRQYMGRGRWPGAPSPLSLLGQRWGQDWSK